MCQQYVFRRRMIHYLLKTSCESSAILYNRRDKSVKRIKKSWWFNVQDYVESLVTSYYNGLLVQTLIICHEFKYEYIFAKLIYVGRFVIVLFIPHVTCGAGFYSWRRDWRLLPHNSTLASSRPNISNQINEHFFFSFLHFVYYSCLGRKLFGFNSDFLNWFFIYLGFVLIYVEKIQLK